MTWSISAYASEEPLLVDLLMRVLGKSLYLACEFERKCQYLFRSLNLIEIFKDNDDPEEAWASAAAAKDRMLGKTIEGIKNSSALISKEIEILVKAKNARNYIAHDSAKTGGVHNMKIKHIAKTIRDLRPYIIDLAKGDNIISSWLFGIEEKQAAPKWMTQTYEARVLNWVLGEPFEEPEHYPWIRLVDRSPI